MEDAMTKKFCTFAAVFALLTVTAPVRAATLELSFDGTVTSGSTVGALVSGTASWNDPEITLPKVLEGEGNTFGGPIETSFSLNGFTTGFGETGYDTLTYYYGPNPPLNIGSLTLQTALGVDLSLTTPNIHLGGLTSFSATGAALNGSGIAPGALGFPGGVAFKLTSIEVFSPSPVPLPAALPMFGSALLALAGFGAYRSRRAVRG
jgi:hypothetical protein